MAPAFDLNTQVIGVPAIVTAGIGAMVAAAFVYKISLCPNEMDHKGDPERKAISDKVVKLNSAIASGAYAFLIVALCLFVLVSAAVNWRTGLW